VTAHCALVPVSRTRLYDVGWCRGLLAEEEQQLYNFRKEKEIEARQQLIQQRDALENQARESQVL
jgi:hypothetical protein